MRSDRDPLEFANRGSQHLWFTNPASVAGDHEQGAGWLATHPSLDARIERLGQLYPQLESTAEAGQVAQLKDWHFAPVALSLAASGCGAVSHHD